MVVKRKAIRFAALVAAGGMLLAGCTDQGAEQPEASPSEEAATSASPSAPEVDLEQYAAALVSDVELMGVAGDPPVEGFVDDPVSMYLTLSDFSPSGTCEELLDELNSYTAPAVAGVSAHFVKEVPSDAATDGAATDGQSPEASEANTQTMIFETRTSEEPMSIYREIPNACETLSSDEVEGAEAEFTKVPGLDAIHLEISDGDGSESMAVGGSSVNGRYHMYMTAEQVSIEEAEEMFGAQAEKLQETFEDEASAEPSETTSESPTEATSAAEPSGS
ncbi:hypothetical protein GCM10027092_05050 [Yaniella soli]